MRQVRQVQDLQGFTYLPARVILPVRDASQRVITINRGTRHGVQEGLVVTVGANLVGQVLADPGPSTATVRLITAPNTFLVVRLIPPVPGSTPYEPFVNIREANDGQEFWAEIDADATVRAGDLAHLADDTWPTEARGFIVGRVQEIIEHPDRPYLSRRVIIKPLRPVGRLSNVVVLIPRGTTPPEETAP